MRDLLVILNPRQVDECIRSLSELKIDRLWVRYMDELTIASRWPEILDAASDYDRLFLISDDGVVRQHALDAVIRLLDEGHPVVTGYSNLDANDYRVNLTRAPLPLWPTATDFEFRTLGEVLCWPEPVVPTTFCGFALTGMSRELWTRFPYHAEHGADWSLAKKLTAQGIPIVGARDAFIWHVKEVWNAHDQELRKQLLVGKEPAVIELEAA